VPRKPATTRAEPMGDAATDSEDPQSDRHARDVQPAPDDPDGPDN
jgi:hypothetical protein